MIVPFLLVSLTLELLPPSWEKIDSGVTTSIRGLAAVDKETCWFGTKSGVSRTIDGGKTWQFNKIGGDELDFRDLHAFDAQRCVAMSAGEGEASRLYLTEDGGKTWRLTYQNKEPKGFFNGIAFRDEKNGVLAGDAVDGRLFLLVTDDGGSTWRRLAENNAPKLRKGEHAFAASGTHLATNSEGHIWVTSGGSAARVFHSPDWGKSWEKISTPMIAGKASTGTFSIAFHGEFGIAVGGDYKKESEGKRNAMCSEDGGKTWKLVEKREGESPFVFRSCVGFVGRAHLIAVGPEGSDFSRDGGITWKRISRKGELGYHTMSIRKSVVWAAGADGRVARLKDL